MKWYAGIGSRKTPKSILTLMFKIALILSEKGYSLRSGGADGADTAFEKGCLANEGNMEIYLPSTTFNKRDTKNPSYISIDILNNYYKAEKIARKFHPAWERLSDFAKKLMIRNTYQILGEKLDKPAKFVVCWTPDGCTNHKERSINTGGTGQAISMANAYNIPVFNLFNDEHKERLTKFVNNKG
jgi:hypothetical protein